MPPITVGYFMESQLTVAPQENKGLETLPAEKPAKTLKSTHIHSEPLWKRNLGKTLRPKKIGEVARAKGGRY